MNSEQPKVTSNKHVILIFFVNKVAKVVCMLESMTHTKEWASQTAFLAECVHIRA